MREKPFGHLAELRREIEREGFPFFTTTRPQTMSAKSSVGEVITKNVISNTISRRGIGVSLSKLNARTRIPEE